MDTPVISTLKKTGLSALSLALVLCLQPVSGALAQDHGHGGGGGGHGGGGHAAGGHGGGGFAGGAHAGDHRGGGGYAGGYRGGGGYYHGGGYYGGGRGTRYLWGGLPFFFYDGYYHGDCGWLHERAEVTGSPYWYHRYHLCRAY